ncbi:MAG: hypothetical protein R3C02_07965 [Planctomycetaceae bacterium]
MLFLLRVRDRRGWVQWFLVALLLSAVVTAVVYFFGPVARGLLSSIGVGLAGGFLLAALPDIRKVQRDVTIHDDRLVVSGSIGRPWAITFLFEKIDDVSLMRPEEWNRPWGGLLIDTDDESFLVGVPRKVSLDTVANILHRLDVAVALSHWEPSDADSRVGITDDLELDANSAQGEVMMLPLEEGEVRLQSPANIAVQLVVALGPLVLALIGAIAAGVDLFMNWGTLSVLQKSLCGGGALLGLILSFVYLLMVGQFIAAAYGVRKARENLRLRPDAIVTADDEDSMTVELFDREAWTATVSNAEDFGFLRVDRPQSRLLFEGNKTRWQVPLSALTTCRIEEASVGKEGNSNPEKRYFVVLAAPHNGDAWEAGMKYTRTDIGNDTAEARYRRAQLLFAQLAEVLTPK